MPADIGFPDGHDSILSLSGSDLERVTDLLGYVEDDIKARGLFMVRFEVEIQARVVDEDGTVGVPAFGTLARLARDWVVIFFV